MIGKNFNKREKAKIFPNLLKTYLFLKNIFSLLLLSFCRMAEREDEIEKRGGRKIKGTSDDPQT